MTELEEQLIKKACERHKKIFPCRHRSGFEHCFTRDNEKVYFWFNTEDQSTHVIAADAQGVISSNM